MRTAYWLELGQWVVAHESRVRGRHSRGAMDSFAYSSFPLLLLSSLWLLLLDVAHAMAPPRQELTVGTFLEP